MLTTWRRLVAVPRHPVTSLHCRIGRIDRRRRSAGVFNEGGVFRVRHFELIDVKGRYRNLVLSRLFIPGVIRTHCERAAIDKDHLTFVVGWRWRLERLSRVFPRIKKWQQNDQTKHHDSCGYWQRKSLLKEVSNKALLADHYTTG